MASVNPGHPSGIAESAGAARRPRADPDAPTGRRIAAIIAERLGHRWKEILLDENAAPGLGQHPWDARPPIVLDTTAAADLGYQAVGDYATIVADTIDQLCLIGRRGFG
ncbi:hypothetical protein ACLMAL_39215 [Nocardia sp. CWNU-33]|uniref:hypothetical protein n=1 Tax=Nocardia sp. CWNU-33 TaxID=3392117 RepID=UPI00398E86C2